MTTLLEALRQLNESTAPGSIWEEYYGGRIRKELTPEEQAEFEVLRKSSKGPLGGEFLVGVLDSPDDRVNGCFVIAESDSYTTESYERICRKVSSGKGSGWVTRYDDIIVTDILNKRFLNKDMTVMEYGDSEGSEWSPLPVCFVYYDLDREQITIGFDRYHHRNYEFDMWDEDIDTVHGDSIGYVPIRKFGIDPFDIPQAIEFFKNVPEDKFQDVVGDFTFPESYYE